MKEWTGKSADLERMLTGKEKCSVWEKARALLGDDTRKIGTYLRKLEKSAPDRVTSKMDRTKTKVWTIYPAK
jgi:hypothetical protein